MKKFSFISFDFIKTLLLIFTFLFFIYIIYFIVFPQEAFCMTPQEVIRSFDPDTYIRHELDGKPIHGSDKVRYYSYGTDTYKEVIYESDSRHIDDRTLEGKLRYDLQANQHLYDTVKNKLFVEAKNKQSCYNNELPIYLRKATDLYNKSDSSTKHGAEN
jgi:hypothetical protein